MVCYILIGLNKSEMEKSNGKILSILLTAFVVLSTQMVNAQFCTFTSQDIQCSGESTGIISFSPTGGTPPYDYEWSHNPLINASEVVDLPADFYSITISDQGGLSEVCNVLLTQPTPISITNVIETDPMCGLMDGSFEIEAVPQSGGSMADLMYSIDGGVTFQTSNIFNNLGADDYLIIVADVNGCFIVDSRQLVEATSVVVNLNTAMCEGGGTIMIDIAPSGGTLPYDYLWSNGNITEDLSGVAQGTYTVVVTDREGCSAEGTYTVENCCDASMFCNGTVTDISCSGSTDGAISLAPTGGTGSGTYDYLWFDGATTNMVTGLGPGFYNVTVTDNSGCMTVCGFDVVEPSPIVLVSIVTSNSICGGSNGVITVEATPPAGGSLSYSLDGATFQASNVFTGLAAGSYTITIRDQNSCEVTETAQVMDLGAATINIIDSSCETNGTVTFEVEATGGTAPYTYSWTGPGGFTGTGATISGVVQGTYEVTALDNAGCTTVLSVTQDNCCGIVIDDVTVVDPMCGLSNGSFTINATPKTGSGCNDLEYSIDGGMTFQMSNQFDDLQSGDYLVIVRDCDACQAAASTQELMNVDGVSLSFTSACANGQINIDVTPVGGTAPFSYAWTGPNGYSSTTEDIENGANGDYTVIITDDAGCTDQMTILEDPSCISGSILGVVWEDSDGDGQNDNSESGVPFVHVSLHNVNGVIVANAFTDGTGQFVFSGQPYGQYYVSFNTDSEYSFTLPNVGSDGSDSDVTEGNGTGTSALFNFTGGDRVIDAGIYRCIPVGELVWFDSNENDQWDPSENGINGLEVRVYKKGLAAGYFLYDYTNTGPKPDTPSDDGYYKFCLPPGEYYLEYIIPPFGLVPVVPGVGGSINDSDLTGANGPNTTSSFTILSGEERCDLSAGYYPMATLGNNIFLDGNSNGIADPGESGMANVTVELYDAVSNQMIETQSTNADGSYLFDYLQKDEYYLKVIPPNNYLITIPNAGNDDNMDSDIDNSNGPNTSPMYSLTPGMQLENVDIGLIEASVVAVDWVSIYGEHKGNYNLVEWTVGFQHNTDYFEVERRTPKELSFSTIDVVSKSSQISMAEYFYQDYDIEEHPLTYYRVVEVDVDGNRSYSDVVSIDFRKTSRATKISVGPNPFIADLFIEIDTPISTQASITFYDARGRLVVLGGQEKANLSEGINNLTFDWSGIPTGVYTVQVLVDNNQYIQKLIKIE